MASAFVTTIDERQDDDSGPVETKVTRQKSFGVRGRSVSIIQALDIRQRISSFAKHMRLSKSTMAKDKHRAHMEGDEVAVADDEYDYLDLIRQQSAAWIAGPDGNKSKDNKPCSYLSQQSLTSLLVPKEMALHAGPQTLATWKRCERERLGLHKHSTRNCGSDDPYTPSAAGLDCDCATCCRPRAYTYETQEMPRFVRNSVQGLTPDESARCTAAFRKRMSVDDWIGSPGATSWHYGAMMRSSRASTDVTENNLGLSRVRAKDPENHAGADHHEYAGDVQSITAIHNGGDGAIGSRPRNRSLGLLVGKVWG